MCSVNVKLKRCSFLPRTANELYLEHYSVIVCAALQILLEQQEGLHIFHDRGSRSSLKETGRDSGQRREKTPQISLPSSFCIERHICAHVPLMMTVYTHSAKQRDKLHHWACLETDPPHWAPLEAQALKLDL